jgi:hypothetical protein
VRLNEVWPLVCFCCSVGRGRGRGRVKGDTLGSQGMCTTLAFALYTVKKSAQKKQKQKESNGDSVAISKDSHDCLASADWT